MRMLCAIMLREYMSSLHANHEPYLPHSDAGLKYERNSTFCYDQAINPPYFLIMFRFFILASLVLISCTSADKSSSRLESSIPPPYIIPEVALFASHRPDALQRWELAKKAANSFQVGVTSRETVEKIIGIGCKYLSKGVIKEYDYWFIPCDQTGYNLFDESEYLTICFDEEGFVKNVTMGTAHYPMLIER